MRVHPTGRKIYVVQSRGPGGPKRVTLGRHGEVSAEEARKRAALAIDRIKRGEDPIPAPSEGELTLSALAERFMRVHVEAHLKPGTAAAYRSVLEKHVLPALGGMAVGEVERGEVSALHHRLRDTPSLANMAVHLLSQIFSLAGAWESIPHGRNPCRALKDAEGRMWPPAIASFRLLALTGCRRSEILNLRWDDVDRKAGELRLRDAKAGPRMVPLTAPVLRVLNGIPRQPDNPWVIPAKYGDGRLLSFHYYWQTVRSRAGLDDVRIHDLRHSCAKHGDFHVLKSIVSICYHLFFSPTPQPA